jgi:hypothetical protein
MRLDCKAGLWPPFIYLIILRLRQEHSPFTLLYSQLVLQLFQLLLIGEIILFCSKYTAKEGPVRIQYKCLVPIYMYVFPKLNWAASLFPKQNYNVLSPNFHIHVSVRDLYIPRIDLHIWLQPNRQTNSGNIEIAHRYSECRNWE